MGSKGSDLLDVLADAAPRVLTPVAIVVVGYALSRGLRWFLRHLLEGRRTPSFAAVMSKLAGWILLSLAIMAAIVAVFPSVKPVDILAGLGFFSVAAGFAFQDILENLLSGLLLILRQPFRSGDQITVGEISGTVQSITIRETRLRTFDGQLVLIPNRDVYKSVITVRTHFSSRRVAFVVGVAYENDAGEACRIIQAALAQDVARMDGSPQPEAFVTQLGVSTVDIEARFWCSPEQHDVAVAMDSAIRTVKAALDAAEIEMPADIVVLQASPSLRAAISGEAEVTPGGGIRGRLTRRD
ncbi:mechanosensitive ion channel family protein [Aeromicrobium sp.]|uniref:mechanosensitive ion channel family protein n=1 Tax=Aeromicrobium sp. TaxID=1871063 RepID=UPI003C4989CE